MTNDDFNYLAKFELHFARAIESGYCRYIATTELKRIADIYQSITSARVNIVCPKCKLALLRDVGRLYYAEKQRREGEKKSKRVKREKHGEERHES